MKVPTPVCYLLLECLWHYYWVQISFSQSGESYISLFLICLSFSWFLYVSSGVKIRFRTAISCIFCTQKEAKNKKLWGGSFWYHPILLPVPKLLPTAPPTPPQHQKKKNKSMPFTSYLSSHQQFCFTHNLLSRKTWNIGNWKKVRTLTYILTFWYNSFFGFVTNREYICRTSQGYCIWKAPTVISKQTS